jgi:hypothetical protein
MRGCWYELLLKIVVFSGLPLSHLTFPTQQDGSDTFLRNVTLHTDYTALHSERWQHPSLKKFPTGSHGEELETNPYVIK